MLCIRSEVSLKAAELDSLNDTLVSEQKRARELQWLYEKDKCKTDRKQEAEREEVEVRAACQSLRCLCCVCVYIAHVTCVSAGP